MVLIESQQIQISEEEASYEQQFDVVRLQKSYHQDQVLIKCSRHFAITIVLKLWKVCNSRTS